MGSQSNQLKNYLIVWIILTIIGIILFLLPALYDVQPVNTAIALLVVGVLIAGVGLGMVINYSVKIIQQNKIKPQSQPIVQWTYTSEEWKEFCVQNLKFNIKSFFKMFYIIIIACVIIDVLFFFLDDYKNAFDLFLSESFFIFLFVIVYPIIIYFINIISTREVKIFESAVMVSNVLYSWDMPQGKLIDIELISNNLPIINFEYSSPLRRINTYFGKQKRSFISVPVPYYELNKGMEIVDKFQKSIDY